MAVIYLKESHSDKALIRWFLISQEGVMVVTRNNVFTPSTFDYRVPSLFTIIMAYDHAIC